jgi:hypothetical protein
MDVSALNKAVTMMCIALPVMFFVIGIFIAATHLLHKTFPAPPEEDED